MSGGLETIEVLRPLVSFEALTIKVEAKQICSLVRFLQQAGFDETERRRPKRGGLPPDAPKGVLTRVRNIC